MTKSIWINKKKEEVEAGVVVKNSSVHVMALDRKSITFKLDRSEVKDFGKELRLILPDGQTVLILDPQLQKKIRKELKGLSLSAKFFGTSHYGVRGRIGSILIILGVFSGMAYLLSPQIAKFVPRSWEKSLGEATFKSFRDEACSGQEADAALNSLLEKLPISDELRADLEVVIVKSDTVNAIALPGGKIVFYSGIIDKMNDPDQFAAVLAHEISHQEYRHFAAGITRAVLMTGLWHIVLGDLTGVLILDPVTIMALVNRSYSRSQESEADFGAAMMLKTANISLKPGSEFLEELSKDAKGMPEFLSTHPIGDRGEDFLSYQDESSYEARPSLSAGQWQSIRSVCL